MRRWAKNRIGLLGTESAERFLSYQKQPARLDDNEELRRALLDFIADFADWDNSSVEEYLETSRALTHAAHEALGGESGAKPLVVDPFAGGGSIPLEALRVGADTFASDLNPVSVLLNKIALEYVPQYGERLAEEVRKQGEWIKTEAEKELAEFYPRDAHGATPIAYLWARTIQCEGPGCGAEVPLMRSLWLAKKANRSVAVQLVPNSKAKRVDFRIIAKNRQGWVDQSNPEAKIEKPNFEGTVRRGSATCPCCGYTTHIAHVRKQLTARHGGANDARLFCAIVEDRGASSVSYRLPNASHLRSFESARRRLNAKKKGERSPISLVPDEPTPAGGGSGAGRAFSQRNYGMDVFDELFNDRQLLALSTFASLIRRVGDDVSKQQGREFALAVCAVLSAALGKLADYLSTLCVWRTARSCVAHTFGRQAIPITWDFGEMNPFAGSAGDWDEACRYLQMLVEHISRLRVHPTSVQRADALKIPLPNDSATAFVTDPPYYDAVPYSDLSDYFYVWHKRALQPFTLDLFRDALTPKAEECIVDEVKGKDAAYFEQAMRQAMAEGRRVLAPEGIAVVVFAHKSTSGWEALLQAMIDAGWIVTGSWPIDTERPGRLRANDSAALASSVHLVCRPRPTPDRSIRGNEVGDWRDLLVELPRRIHDWMPRLAEEGVVGADAIFACLGPALEIFSRYSRVEKASGLTVSLREYLEQVWAAVAKEALALVFKGADASGFEEDARLTAMWLWTLFAGQGGANGSDDEADEDDESEETSSKQMGYVLEYDAARKIAQGLGAHLESLPSLVEIKGETATLVSVADRTRRLFGKDDSESPTKKQRKRAQLELGFVAELEQAEETGSWGSKGASNLGATVLDRVHQSMILFAAGRGEALRRFLVDEGVGRDERYWRLAQVLSFLYPKTSDEKRWIDGVLARKKGLGF
jgi:putative DNA methylase